jgi:hypothetical protein
MVNQLHSLKKQYIRFFSVGFVHRVRYFEHKQRFMIWLYPRIQVLVLSHFPLPNRADCIQRNNG